MMKKRSTLVAALIPIALWAQNTVTIQASIKGLTAGEKVYYGTAVNENGDSVTTTGGSFTIHAKLTADGGDLYVLQIGTDRNNDDARLVLYLDKGTLIITGNGPKFRDVNFTGSSASVKDQNDFISFLQSRADMRRMDSLREQLNEFSVKNNDSGIYALLPQIQQLYPVRCALTKQWISRHKSSPVSSFLIARDLRYSLSLKELDSLMQTLAPEAKNNAAAKEVLHHIRIEKLTGIGRPAIEFTQADTAGRMVSLHDFRGKYVLVDFWASWCHPCRQENPNVLKAYSLYKNKNFTIISVSFDSERDSWLSAIRSDDLPWSQLSDLKGWENAAGKAYAIESIPANFLIDPSGKIIAKDLHGDDLGNTLSRVLK